MGFVTGWPRRILSLEGLAIVIVGLVLYRQAGGSWGLLALLFLVPDLAIVGYFAGPRVGAAMYNIMHAWAAPALLWGLLELVGVLNAAHIPLIWAVHIGFDRTVGFGLRYPTRFADTHLGQLPWPARNAGRAAASGSA
jgi:hypothetical protein